MRDLRREYGKRSLDESAVASDPIGQFKIWFDEAVEASLGEPNAAALATASRDGSPSARIVLIKEFDRRGFVFFTNYSSRKGAELNENPRASLLFFWQALERQVRVEGTVARTSRQESEAYFASRPIGARIGAAASPQSNVVASRAELEELYRRTERECGGSAMDCPPGWGGYRLTPERIEFWQGRENRLHDRIVYILEGGAWRISRLAP